MNAETVIATVLASAPVVAAFVVLWLRQEREHAARMKHGRAALADTLARLKVVNGDGA